MGRKCFENDVIGYNYWKLDFYDEKLNGLMGKCEMCCSIDLYWGWINLYYVGLFLLWRYWMLRVGKNL